MILRNQWSKCKLKSFDINHGFEMVIQKVSHVSPFSIIKTQNFKNLKLKIPFSNNYLWEEIKAEDMTNVRSLSFYECFVLLSSQ